VLILETVVPHMIRAEFAVAAIALVAIPQSDVFEHVGIAPSARLQIPTIIPTNLPDTNRRQRIMAKDRPFEYSTISSCSEG